METGKIVIIFDSEELTEMRLKELVGREAEVVEALYDKHGNVRGAWLKLVGEPYLGEQEWYIPIKSIQ